MYAMFSMKKKYLIAIYLLSRNFIIFPQLRILKLKIPFIMVDLLTNYLIELWNTVNLASEQF